MRAGVLAMYTLGLSGALYGLYRLGIYLERRHRERCFMCGAEVSVSTRDWTHEAAYWDSTSNRWSHLTCKMDEVKRIRQEGGL